MLLNNIEVAAINRAAKGLFAAITVAFLSACAATPADDDSRVVERAQARWDAVIANDLETAYAFYSPGYRSSTSLVDYGVSWRMRKVRYTSAEYLEHSCEASRCIVKFRMGFRVFAPVPGLKQYDSDQAVEDTWVKTSGEWWYLPNK